MGTPDIASIHDSAKKAYHSVYMATYEGVDNLEALDTKESADRIGPVARKELKEKEVEKAHRAMEAHLGTLSGVKAFLEANPHLFEAKAAMQKAVEAPMATWRKLPEDGLTLLSSEKSANAANNRLGELMAETLDVAKREREEARLRRLPVTKIVSELEVAVKESDFRKAGALYAEATSRELGASETMAIETLVAQLDEHHELKAGREFRKNIEMYISEAFLSIDQLKAGRHKTLRRMTHDHIMGYGSQV